MKLSKGLDALQMLTDGRSPKSLTDSSANIRANLILNFHNLFLVRIPVPPLSTEFVYVCIWRNLLACHTHPFGPLARSENQQVLIRMAPTCVVSFLGLLGCVNVSKGNKMYCATLLHEA